jgi:tRNA-dihydrouridine synthase
MYKIGNIEINNPVAVAPMAGISNAAFRVTVKEMGAGLVVCEMISDKGIQFRNEKTLRMLHIEPNEYPLSVQIMGVAIRIPWLKRQNTWRKTRKRPSSTSTWAVPSAK